MIRLARLGLALSTTLAATGCVVEPDPLDAVARTTQPAPSAIPLTGAEVRVDQIYFERHGGAASAWGTLAIDPISVMQRTGIATGFINARVASRWLVHNVAVTATPEAAYPRSVARRRLAPPRVSPPVRAAFDLGTSAPTTRLAMQVVFTAKPLTRYDLAAFETQPLGVFEVTPYEEHESLGLLADHMHPDGLPGGSEHPTELETWPEPDLPPVVQLPGPLADHWELILPHLDNVNAAKNQCAMAALANNLGYLRSTFDLEIPHLNFRGWDGDASLLGQLDAFGARAVEHQCAAAGAETCRDDDAGGILDALYGYIDAYAGPGAFALQHQGGADAAYPAACPSLPDDGPVSNRAGDQVTFEWLCSRVQDGDGIALVFYRYAYLDGPEPNYLATKPVSAHMVRVYGCGETAGQRFLRVLDDDQQDTMLGEEAPVCTVREGLAWEWWPVADINNDGKLNVNLHSLREIEFAFAISAT